MMIMKALLAFLILATTSCNFDEPQRDGRPTINPNGFTAGEEPAGEQSAPLERPDLAVLLQPDSICGCKGINPITTGSTCPNKCANTNPEQATLFVNVEVTENILLNPQLENLQGWCKNELSTADVNPDCFLKISGNNGQDYTFPITFTGSNSFLANIETLPDNVNYIVFLQEQNSSAKSTSLQFRKEDPNSTEVTSGPLQVLPVTQYNCIWRPASTFQNSNDLVFDIAFKKHYYYGNTLPEPIQAGVTDVFCFDIFAQYPAGVNPALMVDSAAFPRLQAYPGAFYLWSNDDIRFYDLDQNGEYDIHDIIYQRLIDKGLNPSSVPQIFAPFPVFETAPPPPFTDPSTENLQQQSMGFRLVPFVDTTVIPPKAYCPTANEYYSNVSPILSELSDLVGVDTEGVFLAKRDPIISINPATGLPLAGPTDYVIIRESLAEQIWFYLNNGLHIQPDDITIANETIMFYWPPNPNSPFIKQANQALYTIINLTQLQNGSSSGPQTNYPPPDNRFACVPKLN